MNIAPRLLSALILFAGILGGTTLASCLLPTEDDCQCEPTGQLASHLYSISGATTYDDDGNRAPDSIDPEGGTLQTSPDEVVISYESQGANISVFYDVDPEPPN